jgi:hypothetical protein
VLDGAVCRGQVTADPRARRHPFETVIGMNPDQHRARAEELLDEAEKAFVQLRTDPDRPDDVGPQEWERVNTLARLAQVHATLAGPPPAQRPVTPVYTDLGGDHRVVHYGDDDPTYDRA